MTNPIQIEASPVFQKNLRTLVKKYRNIRQDLQPVINQLEQGELLGDQISGIGYPVFGTGHLNRDRRICVFFVGMKWTFQKLSPIS
jgi:hypothetical protein